MEKAIKEQDVYYLLNKGIDDTLKRLEENKTNCYNAAKRYGYEAVTSALDGNGAKDKHNTELRCAHMHGGTQGYINAIAELHRMRQELHKALKDSTIEVKTEPERWEYPQEEGDSIKA